MAIKSIRQFASESNGFSKMLSHCDADEASARGFLKRLVDWLTECVRHGRYLVPLSADREALQGIVDYWSARLLQFDLPDLPVADQLDPFSPEAGVPLLCECPYPGLEPYTDADRKRFFGRSALIDECVKHVERDDAPPLLITGRSGSGKSSLLLAGIVPVLHDRHLGIWTFAQDFTPGAQPLDALATEVIRATRRELKQAQALERELAQTPGRALDILAEHCGPRPLLLLIDQFEEIVTLCGDPVQQQSFADVLFALTAPSLARQGFVCRVLLTMRTDHVARLEDAQPLLPLYQRLIVERNTQALSRIKREDIKRAIADPADEIGLRFVPPTLIDDLANQTADIEDGLPLLQYSLVRLWNVRRRNAEGEPLDVIDNAALDTLPDVAGALGTEAQRIYETLTAAQQAVCSRIFAELVVLHESFESPLRRRRNERELKETLGKHLHASAADIDAVIKKFFSAGLLRRFGDGDEAGIEVTHEALFRHWKLTHDLLESGEAKERLHAVKRVVSEAAEWVGRNRTEDYLSLQGERLRKAAEYKQQGWLAEANAEAYVDACVAREDEQIRKDRDAVEHARQAREAQEAAHASAIKAKEAQLDRDAAKKQARTRMIVNILLVLVIMLLVVAALLWRHNANQQLDNARSRMSVNLAATVLLAPSLAAWEGLDVAYTVAQEARRSGSFETRFVLAHELERMDHTTILGERNVPVVLAQDGSSLLQVDRDHERLAIYLIGSSGKRETQIDIPLNGKLKLLASAQVGPRTGAGEERLAALIFRQENGKGFAAEVYRLPSSTPIALHDTTGSALADANVISAISFDASGKHALFSAIDQEHNVSEIIEMSADASGDAELSPVADPVPQNRSFVTAAALGYDTSHGGASMLLITGRDDGSIYCGTRSLRPPLGLPGANTGFAIQQIASAPLTTLFASVDSAGNIVAWDCANPGRPPLVGEGAAQSVTMTTLDGAGPARPVLSYAERLRLRCYIADPVWRVLDCNASHPVNAAVILPDGHQLTVESPSVSAIQYYASEGIAQRDKGFDGRLAGGTAIRWRAYSAESSASVLASHQRDSAAADQNASPWTKEKSEDPRYRILEAYGTEIVTANLSPDGKHIAWIEAGRGKGYVGMPAIRTWMIGASEVQAMPDTLGQPLEVAISNQGTVARVEALDKDIVRLRVDKTPLTLPIDSLLGGIGCMAFSPDGSRLVVGTNVGLLVAYANLPRNTEPSTVNEDASGKMGARLPTTGCAIGDDGTVAAGFSDGQVKLFTPLKDGYQSVALSRGSAYSLPASVKQITLSVNGAQRYVVALGAWQPNSCTRPGLPGQSLRIWEISSRLKQADPPVSKACLPNGMALGVDVFSWNGPKDPGVAWLGADGRVNWHACPGCTLQEETPEVTLGRLMGLACDAHAQHINPDDMSERYGIKIETDGGKVADAGDCRKVRQ